MKIVVLILIYIGFSESLPHRMKRIPVVDDLIQRLERERWPDAACRGDTLRIVYGVRNDTLWATWIWDSMQPPSGIFYGTGMQFGNYDQCLNVPRQDLRTQYCLVDVDILDPKETREFGVYDSADDYINTLTLYGRNLARVTFGVCMPAVCSPSSVAMFFKHVLRLTHLPQNMVSVVPSDCQTAVSTPYPMRFYAYLTCFGLLLSIVIASTIYTHLKDTKRNSKIETIAKSFCIFHNWHELFKVNRNEIRVLNGMRVLSAVMVIGAHHVLFSLFLPSFLTNSVEVDGVFGNKLGQAVARVDLIVDTFFAISGLLLIKGLIGRQKNLLIVMIKRYFRLIGPYAATTFYIMCAARHTGSGPMWPRINSNEERVCEQHWWKNFLMMSYDMRTMCYGVAWYVPCDYHLAILSVLLFWVYRRHRQTGIAVFTIVSLALTAQLAIKAYVKELTMLPFNNVVDLSDIREHKMMNIMYIRWHDRAGAYLVGAAMGALMTVFKPSEYRNVISKTRSNILVITSLFTMTMVATMSSWFTGGALFVAMYIATNRAIWAVAICCLIAACEYGSVGIVKDFLSSSVFVPLSKLTYGIYMTHFFIIQRNINVARTSFKLDVFNVIISVQGTMMLACIAALVQYLLVEAPCINLTNALFSERNENSKENAEKTNNGYVKQNGRLDVNGIKKMKAS